MTEPDVDGTATATAVAAFVADVVIPAEERRRGSLHDDGEIERISLQQQARDAGLFAPQVPVAHGGLGLDRRAQARVFEEAGYSLFGPLALNCSAPDEGNMHLLEVVGDADQQVHYLDPLCRGEVRSCFSMTEPAPGAGSDPSLLRTMATPVADGWRIDGRKWFITGANGAAFTICMARTSGDIGSRGGATMFLVDADNPGMRIERTLTTMDEALVGGHAEIVFENCIVPESAVLGAVDQGFHYAQARLGPARLTHCMRWLGIARRSLDIALGHVTNRQAFGARLADQGMIQQMIADSEIDIVSSRALIAATAAEIDAGLDVGQSSSITKTFVAEAVWRVVDRSVQMCGALAISDDVLLNRYLREVRAFRIYDGPSETHRWAISKRVVRRYEKDQEARRSAGT